jgi:hypothetical protein
VLLASRAPIVVGDAAVTRRDLAMTPARARALFGTLGEPFPTLIRDLETWLARNSKLAQSETGSPGAWPIWDEVTVAYLLGLTRAETHPRPTLREDRTFYHARPLGTIQWITAVDAPRLWEDFARKVSWTR